MTTQRDTRSGSTWQLLALSLALVAALGALALPRLDLPGPYYDEVIQALPSLEFLEGARKDWPLPGSVVVPLFGRPFPWLTQPYMGALKSQLLLPALAPVGNDLVALRLTTLAWSALGLLLCVAAARRLFGLATAAVAGLLLATDPSFVFLSRHDWGSFPLGLVMRCATVLFAATWWQTRKLRHALFTGAALGLGIYNKIDFALFPLAALLALALARRDVVAAALRERRGQTAALAASVGLFSLPIAISLPALWGAAGRLGEKVTFVEKALSLRAVLDGSYFLRLMQVGGRFDAMHALEGVPWSGLGVVSAIAAVGLGVAAARRRAPTGAALLVTVGVCFAALHLMALPGGARAHHLMNLYPFPHWIAALGLVAVWGAGRRPGAWARRAAVGIAIVVVVAGALRVVGATRSELVRSGGRGYWSDALTGFARSLPPVAEVVCLDWGLHNPLSFLDRQVRSVDGPWLILSALTRQRPWTTTGDASTIYLLHADPYGVFGTSALFRQAVSDLPSDRVQVRPHLDGLGDVAFLAVSLRDRHEIVYDGRRFVIRLARGARRGADAPSLPER